AIDDPVVVQAICRVEPTTHSSPPLGAERMKPPRMVKVALESSRTVASAVLVTRTLTVVAALSGTVQVKLPVLAAAAAISVTVAKLSFEYSSFTLGIVPDDVQAIAWVLPTVQVSPPFGATTMSPPWILKFASETSFASASAGSETRTFTVAEIASGMIQL